MISFERIAIDDQIYLNKIAVGELNIFQTSTWLNFISDVQNTEPVIAAIKSGERFLGYYTGMISDIWGFKILGSPPKGPLTYFMGFNLIPDSPKREVLEALPRFAFSDLGCNYLEVIDPNLKAEDWNGLEYRVENLHHFGIDLSGSEEELYSKIDPKGRNKIQQSIKKGVVVEEAFDQSFCDDYYAQYVEVLNKQSLTPTFYLQDVKKMIEHNLPTGNLLLLRARNAEGVCIATGIFLSHNKIGVVWGTASWREYQHLRPNEAITWYGMRKMKQRGVELLHYGSKCEEYKIKFGAKELHLFRLMKMKHKVYDYFLYPLLSPKNDKYREYRNWLLKRIGFHNK